MSIDWKRLGQVRERHQLRAQQEVSRERAAAALAEQALHEAQAMLAQEQASKRALWQQQAQAARLSVEDLRQAGAWSRALDGRIAQAAVGVVAAHERAQSQRERLDASREALQRAARERQKAESMGQRAQRAQLRERELRLEDAADEAALQTQALRNERGG